MKQGAQDTRGIFITFEGGEGAGKSTHIAFLAHALRLQNREVVCTFDPGGTPMAQKIRRVLLDPVDEDITPDCELFMFEAARAQLVDSLIKPALSRGAIVLCDRFCDSTIAYQAFGRGLDRDFVERANAFACKGIVPDRTILMDTMQSEEEGLFRATHDLGADRMENAGLEFHARVNNAFRQLAQENRDRIRIVSSKGDKPHTAHAVFTALADLFGWDPFNLPFDEDFFAQAATFKGKVRHSNTEASDSANAVTAKTMNTAVANPSSKDVH